MTGPEHYQEAERIMREMTFTRHGKVTYLEIPEAMAMAQTHATLALAAAMAVGMADVEERAWADVAATKPGRKQPERDRRGPGDPDFEREPRQSG
jgi:hypothetical protein